MTRWITTNSRTGYKIGQSTSWHKALSSLMVSLEADRVIIEKISGDYGVSIGKEFFIIRKEKIQ